MYIDALETATIGKFEMEEAVEAENMVCNAMDLGSCAAQGRTKTELHRGKLTKTIVSFIRTDI